jgi:hypothetical protein
VDPDPAFQLNPDLIRIQGFDDQNLEKKILLKIYLKVFDQKLQFIYPWALIKGRPSYRRSLPSPQERTSSI